MIISLVLALVPLSFDTPVDEAAQETEQLVRYDLRPVTPLFDQGEWSQSMVPAVASPYDELPQESVRDLYAEATPEIILDVVSRILGDEMHFEGREISLDGSGSLLVLAPPATQQKIRRILDAIESALSSAIEIQLDTYTLAQGEASMFDDGVISIQEAERLGESLVRAGAVHRKNSFDLFPGRTATLDETRKDSFVLGYEIEIAQGVIAYEPFAVPISTGLRVFMRGTPSPNGTVLSLLYSDAELPEGVQMRPLKSGAWVGNEREGGLEYVAGPGSYQSVDLLHRSVALTTFIPDNEAVVIASESNRRSTTSRQVVILRRIGSSGGPLRKIAFPGTSTSLLMVNSELMSMPEFEFASGSEMSEISNDESKHPYVIADMGAEPSLFLFEWLKYRFSVYRRLGPWALVVTDPAWDNDAANELEKLVASVQVPDGVIDVSVELASSNTRASRWSMPVLSGTRYAAVLGYSSTALVNYKVEVAHFAAVAGPQMESRFEGLAFTADASRRGPDILVEASGTGQVVTAPSRTFDPASALMGSIDQLPLDRIVFDDRRRVKAGGALSVGSGSSTPSDGSGLRFSLRVR